MSKESVPRSVKKREKRRPVPGAPSFAIDAATGKLTPTGHVSTGGHWPRNFTLSPSGRWLLVANQKSDSIVVFRIDPETGLPAPTGQTVAVPAPVCLRFR